MIGAAALIFGSGLALGFAVFVVALRLSGERL